MSVKDVIKSSVYENLGGGTGLSIYEIIFILAVTCLVGIYIYYTYKCFARAEFYSKELNITLAGMAIIVAAIMIAMQSNLLVSLGMVGALSIVRFRTAVKSPIDLLYLFWSISAGIICGVGLYVLAIVLCIIMTAVLWFLGRLPASRTPGLVVIRMSMDTDMAGVEKVISDNAKKADKKSASIKGSVRELICEVTASDINALVNAVNDIEGVNSVNYLEHSGEFRG